MHTNLMIGESFLIASAFERLGWTLVHFLWQGTVVALVAFALFRLMNKQAASSRYLAGLLCMALMALCPIVTFINLSSDEAAQAASNAIENNEPTEASQREKIVPAIETPSASSEEVFPSSVNAEPTTQAMQQPKQSDTEAFLVFALAMGWILGVVILGTRLMFCFRGVRRLRSDIVDPPDWIVEKSRAISKSMSAGSPVVAISTRISEGIATGLIKPMVLLPASWISELPPDMIESIIAHEMAHIRRGDLWVNLIQRVIETLLFYHPAVWWVSNRVRVERELCCDAMVVTRTQNPLRYAETLALVGRLCVSPKTKPLVVASVGTRRVLLTRISSVLHPPSHDRASSTWLAGLVPLMFLVAVVGSLSLPSVDNQAIVAADAIDSTNSELNVIISEASGEKPEEVYLTLWKEMASEEAPKNTVNGPDGFGYYDPVIWDDSKSKVRWKRFRNGHHSGDKPLRFESLPSGKYRVTAISSRAKAIVPDPTPFGVSKLISIGDAESKEIKLPFQNGTASLRLKLVDESSREPIHRVALRLRDDNGMPIVHGHGSGNFFERTGSQGEVNYDALPAGNYTVEILGRHARTGESIEYPPMESFVSVEVNSKGQELEIAVPSRELSPAEVEKKNPFSIVGKVTDRQGNPLANVGIRAATGVGTLIGGGSTKTDAEGNYKLFFGPQVSERSPLGIGVQAVHLYLEGDEWSFDSKDGYLFYLMTDQTPEQFSEALKLDGKVWSKSDTSEVVFANTPKAVDLVLSKSSTTEDNEDESIIWGPSRNGLVAGAKLLSASGKLQPGDPVVVQFVLKNESDEEQTFVLNQFDTPRPVLGGNNRLELNLTGNSQQQYQHTLGSGEVMEQPQYRVNVSTKGMLAGSYNITSGSAFWMAKDGQKNRATGVPFRKKIPFTLGDPTAAKLSKPPADDDLKVKTHWGEPTGQLFLGMRIPDGRETWPDDAVDIEGQLVLFNAGKKAVKLKYDVPSSPADWNMHVTSRDHDNYVRLDSTWFTGLEPTRTVDLTIEPGESVPVTGIRRGVSTGGNEAVDEMIGGPMVRIMKDKTEFKYGDPKRLIDQQGRFHLHAALSISIDGLDDPLVIASSGPVPFEVGSKD